jgi:hypothetical protein
LLALPRTSTLEEFPLPSVRDACLVLGYAPGIYWEPGQEAWVQQQPAKQQGGCSLLLAFATTLRHTSTMAGVSCFLGASNGVVAAGAAVQKRLRHVARCRKSQTRLIFGGTSSRGSDCPELVCVSAPAGKRWIVQQHRQGYGLGDAQLRE